MVGDGDGWMAKPGCQLDQVLGFTDGVLGAHLGMGMQLDPLVFGLVFTTSRSFGLLQAEHASLQIFAELGIERDLGTDS
jgi:hypothetical protein